MSSRLKDLLKRFAGYFSSSLLGTTIDTLVLWLCSHYLLEGTYFTRNILSPVISFECAVLTNFCCAYFFVWKDRVSERTAGSFFRHYGAFNLSCTGTFLVKLGLLQLVVLITGLDVVICNLIALCFSGLLNFTLTETVIFKRKKKTDKNDYVDALLESIKNRDKFNCDCLFLELDDCFFANFEVLLGPGTTESDKIIAKALLENYCVDKKGLKKYTLEKSSLKIRTK